MTDTLDAVIDEVVDLVDLQEALYGLFEPTIASVRLGIAILEDELAETLQAWRDERPPRSRRTEPARWPETRTEALQLAAVAVRLAKDLG